MKVVSLALVLIAFLPACGGDKAARRGSDGDADLAMRRAAPPPRSADTNPSMSLDSEVGVMDTDDVQDTIEDHFDAIRDCYARAGKAQSYAGGKVVLRFLIDGDGTPQDVRVLESSLGNYDVERCLVEVGRKIQFHAPGGHKPTTFEYPVEFRSTSGVEVLDVDGPKAAHDFAALMPQLAACGRVADEEVNALVYIEPSGFPGSVGLATAAALDESAGDCVVHTVRRWKMSVALPGHVVKASFSIPPRVATAEASRHLHRRRR
jgi:TonB family protein